MIAEAVRSKGHSMTHTILIIGLVVAFTILFTLRLKRNPHQRLSLQIASGFGGAVTFAGLAVASGGTIAWIASALLLCSGCEGIYRRSRLAGRDLTS